MPDAALPQPWPEPLPGLVVFQRVYRDARGRPMTGKATLTGSTGTRVGDTVVPPTPVVVEIVGGLLRAELLPDTYRLQAQLRTVDGERASDRDEITVEASA